VAGKMATTSKIGCVPRRNFGVTRNREAPRNIRPSELGHYTIRVKAPHGEKLMPHKHPDDGVYTAISVVFYIGLGDEFDASKLEAYAPGAVIILPGNTPHFHWAKSGEYVTQITAMGPLRLECLSTKDGPQNNSDGKKRRDLTSPTLRFR
jgi:hypothetical protein